MIARVLAAALFMGSPPADDSGAPTLTDPFGSEEPEKSAPTLTDPFESEPAPEAPPPAPAAESSPTANSAAPGPAAPRPGVLDAELERRNELRGAGTALAIVSVISLGAAVGLQLAHAKVVGRCYDDVFAENGEPNLGTLSECERNGLGMRWGARILQPTTVALGLGAGGLLGKGYAYTDAALGRQPQATGGYAAGGGVLFGAGGIAYVVTRVVFLLDRWKNRCAHIGFSECARHNQLVIDLTADASMAAMAYGGMMMTYGSRYARASRKLQASLLPQVRRGYAGLGISGAF